MWRSGRFDVTRSLTVLQAFSDKRPAEISNRARAFTNVLAKFECVEARQARLQFSSDSNPQRLNKQDGYRLGFAIALLRLPVAGARPLLLLFACLDGSSSPWMKSSVLRCASSSVN